MSRYIEGYYSSNEWAADNLSNPKARKILDALERLYPWGGTTDEIAMEAKESSGTAYKYLTQDLMHFRIKKDEPKKNVAGEHLAGRGTIRYEIENQSFALNKHNGFRYEFSPGYVNYKPDFLHVWELLTEKTEIDKIHVLLVKLLERIFSKIESPPFDPRIQKMAPRIKGRRSNREPKDMVCNHCGINHEASALVYHTLNQRYPHLIIKTTPCGQLVW
jgi:hypothetical protein